MNKIFNFILITCFLVVIDSLVLIMLWNDVTTFLNLNVPHTLPFLISFRICFFIGILFSFKITLRGD